MVGVVIQVWTIIVDYNPINLENYSTKTARENMISISNKHGKTNTFNMKKASSKLNYTLTIHLSLYGTKPKEIAREIELGRKKRSGEHRLDVSRDQNHVTTKHKV